MKIAFCMCSNRPQGMVNCSSTIKHAIVKGVEFRFFISYEPNVTEQFRREIRANLEPYGKVSMKERMKHRGKYIPFHKMRMTSFEMAGDWPDYIYMIDDDSTFKSGTPSANYSSGDRYYDAVKYMEANPDCGMVWMKPFLGGANMGRKIVPFLNGLYSTSRGIIIRNQKYPLVHPKWMYPGAGNDTSIAFTGFLHGYYSAKALNTPTHRPPSKKGFIRPGASTKYYTDSPSYNFNEMKDGTFIGEFRKEYGPYNVGGKLPPKLLAEYREAAMKKFGKVMM